MNSECKVRQLLLVCVCTKFVLTFVWPAELGWSRRKSERCLCGKRLLHFFSPHKYLSRSVWRTRIWDGSGANVSEAWGLCVPCRSSWSSSCCRLGWPSGTPTGSSRLATPPGTSTMRRTPALPTGASSTSGATSSSSTPWCPFPSMWGRHCLRGSLCQCERSWEWGHAFSSV